MFGKNYSLIAKITGRRVSPTSYTSPINLFETEDFLLIGNKHLPDWCAIVMESNPWLQLTESVHNLKNKLMSKICGELETLKMTFNLNTNTDNEISQIWKFQELEFDKMLYALDEYSGEISSETVINSLFLTSNMTRLPKEFIVTRRGRWWNFHAQTLFVPPSENAFDNLPMSFRITWGVLKSKFNIITELNEHEIKFYNNLNTDNFWKVKGDDFYFLRQNVFPREEAILNRSNRKMSHTYSILRTYEKARKNRMNCMAIKQNA